MTANEKKIELPNVKCMNEKQESVAYRYVVDRLKRSNHINSTMLELMMETHNITRELEKKKITKIDGTTTQQREKKCCKEYFFYRINAFRCCCVHVVLHLMQTPFLCEYNFSLALHCIAHTYTSKHADVGAEW